MTVSPVLDAAGRRRSPATMPGYHAGRPPSNKGRVYPADPPTVEEIVAVMREASDDRHGYRLRALIVVLWRAYAQRRIAEGKTKQEIIRCLKRYIARETYHTLCADLADLLQPPPRPATAINIRLRRRSHRPHPTPHLTSIGTSGGGPIFS
jgi:hypothetical protein